MVTSVKFSSISFPLVFKFLKEEKSKKLASITWKYRQQKPFWACDIALTKLKVKRTKTGGIFFFIYEILMKKKNVLNHVFWKYFLLLFFIKKLTMNSLCYKFVEKCQKKSWKHVFQVLRHWEYENANNDR